MNKTDICISSQMNLQIELAGSAPRSGYRYGFPNCPTNRNPPPPASFIYSCSKLEIFSHFVGNKL